MTDQVGGTSSADTYAEFRLRIERGPSKRTYRVYATGPAGQVDGLFRLPFSDLELENFILKIRGTRSGVRSMSSREAELAKEFGSDLFDALFDTEVRGLYRASSVEATNEHKGLRISIALTSVPELLRVPWEFMYDRPTFPSTDRRTPIVRYLDLPKPIKPFRIQLPLRILAIVSAPLDAEPIDAAKEAAKLDEALAPLQAAGAVVCDWLPQASLSALYRRLSEKDHLGYHILHFIGHGGFVKGAKEGVLLLEDEKRGRREETGDRLGAILHSEESLRLVVLNSCEGARASVNDPFSGVATSLIEHEVPAVIGMQFEITDRAAILFAGEFYRALADGRAVDESLSQARMAIFADNNDIEWGTPVLFTRVTDGRLFTVQSAAARVPYKEGLDPAEVERRRVAAAAAAAETSPGGGVAAAGRLAAGGGVAVGAAAAGAEVLTGAGTWADAGEAAETGTAAEAGKSATTEAALAHATEASKVSGRTGDTDTSGTYETTDAERENLADEAAAAEAEAERRRQAAVEAAAREQEAKRLEAVAIAEAERKRREVMEPERVQRVEEQRRRRDEQAAEAERARRNEEAAKAERERAQGQAEAVAERKRRQAERRRRLLVGAGVGVVGVAAVMLLLFLLRGSGASVEVASEPGGGSRVAHVSGKGFEAGEVVVLKVALTPVGTATAAHDGTFETSITIPSDVVSPASLDAVGETSRRSASRSLNLVASASGSLATTGGTASDVGPSAGTQPSASVVGDGEPSIVFYSDVQPGSLEKDNEIYTVDPTTKQISQLTTNTVEDAFATWSPHHSLIAFGRGESGEHDIYTMDAQGGSQERKVSGSADDWFPAWSKDDVIAFVRDNSEIWVLRGGSTKPLIKAPAGRHLRSPAWAPDGADLAIFGDLDEKGNDDLYVVHPDGTPVRLTTEAFVDRNPTWSPDGRTLAFVRDRGENGDADNDIFLFDVPAKGIGRQLTDNDVRDGNPVWSPDGTQIAFYRAFGTGFHIMTINVDGTDLQDLMPDRAGKNVDPNWR